MTHRGRLRAAVRHEPPRSLRPDRAAVALAAAGRAPRVVTVASTAHFGGDGRRARARTPDRATTRRRPTRTRSSRTCCSRSSCSGWPTREGPAAGLHRGAPGRGRDRLVGDPQGMGANRMIRTVAPVFLRVLTQSAAAGARATLYAATSGEPGSYTGPQRFGESRGRDRAGEDVDLRRVTSGWRASCGCAARTSPACTTPGRDQLPIVMRRRRYSAASASRSTAPRP